VTTGIVKKKQTQKWMGEGELELGSRGLIKSPSLLDFT